MLDVDIVATNFWAHSSKIFNISSVLVFCVMSILKCNGKEEWPLETGWRVVAEGTVLTGKIGMNYTFIFC